MDYIISVLLVMFSALFSGLTLGLLSLDVHALKRQADLGNSQAARIYPVRLKGNLLLTTLLLGNVLVNTTLSVFLSSIASGLVAGIIATAAIFIFGEILPQAVISRYALWFGSRTVWLVRIFIFILYPITFPIAWILDRALGAELPEIYSKTELMKIISDHEDSEHSPIDSDEERILHGALMFSHTRVKEAMTALSDVVMYEGTRVLTEELAEEIGEQGHSRIPIFQDRRDNVVGVLYAKDLLVEEEGVALSNLKEAFDSHFLRTRPDETLDNLLSKMLKSKLHMAMVFDSQECVGVITLEDILEEIIQQEIEDEGDE